MESKINLAVKNTKARIFVTAAQLFATQGYDRVSIRQICEDVGVGKPTLYYYFKDKESLLNELIEYTLNIARDLIGKYTENKTDFYEQLSGIITAHHEFAQNYPDFVRLFRMVDFTFLPIRIKTQIINYSKGMFDKIIEFLSEGKQQGYIDPDMDLIILANTLIGTLNQLLHRYLFLKDNTIMSKDLLDKLFKFWKIYLFKQPN